ncbi:MAG: hypothetical protein IT288_02960 [Bdellovibrionales bacterium]|nr:hypothetical protein [Bdellovibrionales bacterium]
MVVNALNFLILLLFLYGRQLAHKDKVLHAKVMLAVMAGDLGLLLFLTFFREALGAVKLTMPWILIVHIILALITMGAYIMALINGIRLLRGNGQVKSQMRMIDRVALPGRILVFVTSVMLYLSKAS